MWGAVQGALETDDTFEVTYRIHTADDEMRWVWEQGGGVRDDDGELLALEGFILDVTERHRLEEELRRTARRFTAVVEASPEPIIALDVGGNVTLWNAVAEEAFGWDESEALGGPLPLVPEEKREEHREIVERVLEGESIEGIEVDRQTADGEPVRVSVSIAPLTDDGEVTGLMSVVTRVDG